MIRLFLLVLGCFLISGCATYQKQVSTARQDLYNRQPQLAARKFQEKAEQTGSDQLIYLLDWGIALHEAKEYRKSIEVLLRADELVDFNDYLSLSRFGGSLLLNEEMQQYKGEPYEKILINVYLALNFLMLKDYDGAAVEARKLNLRMELLGQEGEERQAQSALARYLSALIWEQQRNWDSAYIDFNMAYKYAPNFPYIGEKLIRAAYMARRSEDLKKWQRQWPAIKVEPSQWKKQGELVVIFQQGWVHRKQPRRGAPRFPALLPVRVKGLELAIYKEGKLLGRSESIYDIGRIASKNLEENYGEMVAKKMAGIATKAVVADQVRQKNETLGHLTWAVLNVLDRADLRQWSTLPNSVQFFHVYLDPGEYSLELKSVGRGGSSANESTQIKVKIEPRAKTFATWRSFK